MGFLLMSLRDREALLSQLAAMPDFLNARFADLEPSDARLPGSNDSFSPVEHCWHLADLEIEGYAVRIRRLRSEVDASLPAFDGGRVAEERKYKTLSLTAGIETFRKARSANLKVLRSVASHEWARGGSQEGGGVLSLGEVPAMMAEHDAAPPTRDRCVVARAKRRRESRLTTCGSSCARRTIERHRLPDREA